MNYTLEYKTWCEQCGWKKTFDSGEEAEQACFDHHDDTGHEKVWYSGGHMKLVSSHKRANN